MNNMVGYNARREERTEERVGKLVAILRKNPQYRDALIARLGLGETTANVIIQSAMKRGLIYYDGGLYKVNE